MALKKLFEGLLDFSTEKPAVLRTELQRLVRAIDLAFVRAAAVFEPVPRVVKLVAGGRAEFFDLIVADTTSGTVTIDLPIITAQDEGKWVEVLKTVVPNVVVLQPQDGQLINSAGSSTLTSPTGIYRFRVTGGKVVDACLNPSTFPSCSRG